MPILGAFGGVAMDAAGEVFGRSWFRLRAGPRPDLHRFVVTRSFRSTETWTLIREARRSRLT